MKRSPTRRQIQSALVPALVEALDALRMEQDSTTLLRTIRALTEVAFDLAVAAECPRELMLEQVARVMRRRQRDLQARQPVWLMRPGRA